MQLDFITVVHKEELPLLKIQARSFSQYLNNDYVNNINIIINDEKDIKNDIDVKWWGVLASKVNLIYYYNLGFIPMPHIHGWYTQQICKLLAAASCFNEWSIIFDAKTWLVKNFSLLDLFDNNKPIVGSVAINPYWEPAKKYLESFYQINILRMLGPGGVPFIFHNNTVKEMIKEIPNFAKWFQERVPGPGRNVLLVTEFLLYTAYLYKKFNGFEKLYSNKIQNWFPVNISVDQSNAFDFLFNHFLDKQCLTASIHRDVYKNLSDNQIDRWLNFLENKNLINYEERTYVKKFRK